MLAREELDGVTSQALDGRAGDVEELEKSYKSEQSIKNIDQSEVQI